MAGQSPEKQKILLLIRSLNIGGAERQLVKLAIGLCQKGFFVKVAVFYDGGFFESELHEHKVPLIFLEKGGRWDILSFWGRLFRLIRKESPDILYSFLTTSNVISGIAKRIFPRMKVVWGLRASNMDLKKYTWLAKVEFAVCRYLSRGVDMIIANSRAGAAFHRQQGFCQKNIVVIPNGIETDRFVPDQNKRHLYRKQLRMGENQILVGIVGRLDPMKDHDTFLEAAALLLKAMPDVRFVVIGGGADDYKSRLEELAVQRHLTGKIVWVGQQSDMVACYNALDVLCLSSAFGEGFPNVVGEAMSCGVPCAVTDVGDAAAIVGNYGEVGPPGDPGRLAACLMALLNRLEREPDIRVNVRSRILEKYSLESLRINTQKAFAML